MADTGYNGWTNYPTWNVALWLSNEQGSHDHCADIALTTNDTTSFGFTRNRVNIIADHIEQYVGDQFGRDDASMATDLMTWALGQVNWVEIAQHYADDYPYEGDDDDSDDE